MRCFIKQLQKHAAEWRLAFFLVEILMFNKRPQTFFNLWQKPDIFCQRGSRQKAHVLPREDPLVRKYSLRTLWNLFLWGTNGDFFLLNLWWKCSIKHQYGHLDGGWWIHSPSVPPVLKACVVPILHSISFFGRWLLMAIFRRDSYKGCTDCDVGCSATKSLLWTFRIPLRMVQNDFDGLFIPAQSFPVSDWKFASNIYGSLTFLNTSQWFLEWMPLRFVHTFQKDGLQ